MVTYDGFTCEHNVMFKLVESLCCTPESNVTLCVDDTKIFFKNHFKKSYRFYKKKKKGLKREELSSSGDQALYSYLPVMGCRLILGKGQGLGWGDFLVKGNFWRELSGSCQLPNFPRSQGNECPKSEQRSGWHTTGSTKIYICYMYYIYNMWMRHTEENKQPVCWKE